MMQAYAGLMSVNGHPGAEPARVGTSIVDMGTGMWAALGIVAALRERDRTGQAVEVTTALFETALMWVSYQAMGYLGSGRVPAPQGSGTAMIAPYQAFPTADGYAMIAAPSDAMFARLCQALEAADIAHDVRFADNPSRVRHGSALADALSARTREQKTTELVETLRRAGVPCAPILTIDAVLAEPQTQASGMLLRAPHPRLADYTSVGLPLQWNTRRPAVRRVPPQPGEHSEDVLTWLGYTRDDVRGLRGRGVIT
jgi:crotonobetainyl-CoA:carnitine CoA-transferase CaiB-like acyl-CoA transferase